METTVLDPTSGQARILKTVAGAEAPKDLQLAVVAGAAEVFKQKGSQRG
jgi:hypothetical protein